MPFMNFSHKPKASPPVALYAGTAAHPGAPRGDTLGLVPLNALCPPLLKLKNGAFVLMLEFPALEVGATGARREHWIERYAAALEQLPAGTTFQLSALMEAVDPEEDLAYFLRHAQDWREAAGEAGATERARRSALALAEAGEQMTASLAQFYDATRPVQTRLVITLMDPPPLAVSKSWLGGGHKAQEAEAQERRYREALGRLAEREGLFQQAFSAAGLPLVTLPPAEMARILWRALHPQAVGSGSAVDLAVDLAMGAGQGRAMPPPEAFPAEIPEERLAELLAPDTAVEREDSLEVDGVFLRGYILYDYKPYQKALLYRLSDLPGGWLGSLHVEVADPMQATAQLDQRQVQVDAGRFLRASRGAPENYGAEMEAQAVKESRARLAASGQGPVLTRLFVFRTAPDPQTLDKRCRDLESLLVTLGVRYLPARYSQMPLWQSTWPVGTLTIKQTPRNLTAQSLSTFFWPPKLRQNDPDGLYVGVDEDTGLPVRLDFLGARGERTPSVLALGRPGAGKSVTLRAAMVAGLLHGAGVFAVDLEGEMRSFTQQYGGRYIEIGAPGSERINILDIPPDADNPLAAGTEHLVAFCAAVRGAEIPPGVEWNTLAEAYRLALIDRGWITPEGMPTEGERSPLDAPRLVDIVRILERQGPTGVSMAEILRPYAEGVYAMYFNAPTTFDIAQEKLVVFGLQQVNLQDTSARLRVHLWQVMGLIWGEIVRRYARDPRGMQMVVLDELWAILAAPGGAGAIENMARRFRKRRAILWMATQQTGEFVDAPEGRRILNIAGNTFLMEQRPAEARRLQQVLDLPDGLARLLERIGTGRGIWVRPEGSIRLYVAVPDSWGVL